VIGAIFAMTPGTVSEPIQGNGGVFVVQLDRFYEPPAISDYAIYREQLLGAFRSRLASNPMFTALQEKADIEDNRLLFF
jgi:peptidylprolyl isomerase/peptidyl-prolyl cis-trans isomerase D